MADGRPFTILVNTSDSYSDCWPPFFKLLRTYWPDCPARVVLATEGADYSYPGVAITCAHTQARQLERRVTWSEGLLAALATVDTPIVLYMQEDYFLEAAVDNALVLELADVMLRDATIRHLGLTTFATPGPFELTADERLWRISSRAPYRISTQAALWRTEALASYVRPHENGWMFEIYGTRRSWRRRETFLTLNKDRYRGREPLPYSHAGVVKGKWERGVPALFAKNGITMDFSRRGFFEPQAGLLQKAHVIRKLLAQPLRVLPGLLGW